MSFKKIVATLFHCRGSFGGRWLGLLIVLTIASLSASDAHAAVREDPLASLTRNQRQSFSLYTRQFCTQFFRYGDDRFVILPNHRRQRENSGGRTYQQVLEQLTEVRRVKSGSGKTHKKIHPPNAELIAAAKLLPFMTVGHYGHVNSVKVEEILGPDEMIVSSLTMIRREDLGDENNKNRKAVFKQQQRMQSKTFRLLGFRTDKARVGQEYQGPKNTGLHVAVMSTDAVHDFVLVDYDKLKRVRTHEFAEVLAYVQITPADFIDMVRDNREAMQAKGDRASLIKLYRLFYNRYRPTQPASVAVAAPVPQPGVGDGSGNLPTKSDPETGKPEVSKPEGDKPEPGGALAGDTETTEPDEPETPSKGRDYDREVVFEDDEPLGKPEPRKADPEPRPARDETSKINPAEDDWDPEEDIGSSDDGAFFGIPF